ncbi:MAG: low molecular weight protein-tyrosine-phosphatase [Sphingomonadaceae bacterium]
MTVRVLFVCLGNICRSPLAEAAFRVEAEKLGLDAEIDSAGTGDWHLGHPPDPRAAAVAKANGIDIGDRRARRVKPGDFYHYDHIIALDAQNRADLEGMRPDDARAEISLLLDHVDGREGEAVKDPYYGNEAAFESAWEDARKGARALARRIADRQ